MSLNIFPATGMSLLFHDPLPCYRHVPARASSPCHEHLPATGLSLSFSMSVSLEISSVPSHEAQSSLLVGSAICPSLESCGIWGFNGLWQLAEPASILHFPWEEFKAPPCLALVWFNPCGMRGDAGSIPVPGADAGRRRSMCQWYPCGYHPCLPVGLTPPSLWFWLFLPQV